MSGPTQFNISGLDATLSGEADRGKEISRVIFTDCFKGKLQ